MKDGLVTCPHCNSSLCYAQRQEETGTELWSCLACGFSSTNLLKDGSEEEKAFAEKQPQLYRDLKYIDKDGFAWYPSVLTVPRKGMVFVDGTSKEDWHWAAAKFIQLTRQQKRARKRAKLPDRDYTTGQVVSFGQKGYAEAAAYVGAFEDVPLEETES